MGLLPKCSPVLLLNADSSFLNRIQGFILYTKNILYTSWQQKVQYFDKSWTTLSSVYRRNIKNKHSAHTHTHLTAVSHLNHHHFKPGLRTQSQSPLLGVLDPDHTTRSFNLTATKIYCVKNPPTFSHNAKDFKLIHHITKCGGSSSRWNELLGF